MINPNPEPGFTDIFNANSETANHQFHSTWLSSSLEASGNSNSLRSNKIIHKLLVDATSYAEPHLDLTNGLLSDDTGRPNVRDTAIGALLWAELGQISLAQKAIEAVLDCQVMTRASQQFGNFPDYVGNVPSDSNWSAFIGSYLIVFHYRYGAKLTPALLARLRAAIKAAAIHRLAIRQDVSYTNITILSAFVLMAAGELLNEERILRDGLNLWNAFSQFTNNNGIGEYNSPNYLKVDFYGLGFIVDYIRDLHIVSDASRIRRLFWRSVTEHYHSPTSQLAGPFSRTYTDRMIYENTGLQTFLYCESEGRIPLPELGPPDDNALHAVLPLLLKGSWQEEWIELALLPIRHQRQFRERTATFSGADKGCFQQITTYLDDHMAFGSVNKELLNSSQRRPLIAHALDDTGVGVFKLDGVPTPNTFIMITQQNRSALVVISTNTYNVDPARQVDIRLKWFGSGKSIPSFGTDSSSLKFGEQSVMNWMNLPVAVRFAENTLPPLVPVALTWRRSDPERLLEIALQATLSGLSAQSTAVLVCVFAIHIGHPESPSKPVLAPITVRSAPGGNEYRIIWTSPDGRLEMAVPKRPDSWRITQWLNDQPIVAVPLREPTVSLLDYLPAGTGHGVLRLPAR
jgi:hypothetical protein